MPKTCILTRNCVSCPKGLMFDVLEGPGSGGRSPFLIYMNFGVDVLTKPSVLKNRMAKTCILRPNFVSCPTGLMFGVLKGGGSGGRLLLLLSLFYVCVCVWDAVQCSARLIDCSIARSLYCSTPCRTVLYRTVSYPTVPYRIAPRRTAPHRTVFFCEPFYCSFLCWQYVSWKPLVLRVFLC